MAIVQQQTQTSERHDRRTAADRPQGPGFLRTDGDAKRFPGLVAELIHLNVDLIVTRGTPAVLAAKNATSTTPVVMAAIGEPLLVKVRIPTIATVSRPTQCKAPVNEVGAHFTFEHGVCNRKTLKIQGS
jgi:hypothetical protein